MSGRVLTSLCLVLFCLSSTGVLADKPTREEFIDYCRDYDKVYASKAKADRRFSLFTDVYETVEAFNEAKERPFLMGYNVYSDLTEEEYRRKALSGSVVYKELADSLYENQEPLSPRIKYSLSWRNELENNDAFRRIYVRHMEAYARSARLPDLQCLKSGDEEALRAILLDTPVISAIDATNPTFRHYASGVFVEGDCDASMGGLNHGVLITGYGMDEELGEPYWEVKSFMDSSWGEGGYFKVARGSNVCGITTAACFPRDDLKKKTAEKLQNGPDTFNPAM
uniref:Uncharacterized protein n=1 Tax=Palpitomonas bilix TaxID=652834 RepID=A0A7S3GKW5_9EUKA|mmetsp:Transcript_7719/g.20029  ORF Transcript_7719/g.20029 Transcript_7719/m.20029 type:complete len:282 (+) Transcript_7719:98-943(+)|eukprot:CAMPEP_0113880334 /NCGR_PEP_ID=MMETSP0780_2-20120614/7727_1 /TAXON_ID=652834 /ORGANISM="Palpitomonas bilix" /LENGTH=281 /DNA_ID=CAMNT_0000866997 /DNA_START=183 /DNA_END=1028 /DNA_ORIENTATION=+ /assembly_acc=CAM_ASM_000599